MGQLGVASRDGPWWCCGCVGPVSTSTAWGARVVVVARMRVNEGVRIERSLALIDMLQLNFRSTYNLCSTLKLKSWQTVHEELFKPLPPAMISLDIPK